MRALIDTNILADVLLGRDPYYDIAYNVLALCASKKVSGYIAAHSIPNLFYILRNSMSGEERGEALRDICQIVKAEGIDSFKILSALDNGDFSDFEDCLQEECAVAVSADFLLKGIPKLLFFGMYLFRYSERIIYQQIVAALIAMILVHILYIFCTCRFLLW